MSDARPHIPVLLNEVIETLNLQPNENVIDGTVGAGGHSEVMLERIAPNGRLLGFDLDEAALELARRNLTRFGSRVMLVRASYAEAPSVLADREFGPIQAALLDLGYSSIEIDDATRGFSFRFDGPLDMRFDARQELTAAEIVNTWNEDDITDIIIRYGEERYARRIAAAICKARRQERIIGTFQLVDVIKGAVPGSYRNGQIHPATRTFQALRIATNDELGNVERGIIELFKVLAPGGRLAVISFHSLEDRITKRQFRDWEKEGAGISITNKPVTATDEEARTNPRARSAKLRVIKKN